MRKLKIIGIEIVITILSIVMIVRTLFIETSVGNKVFLSIGICLSIIYLIYRINQKLKEDETKQKLSSIAMKKFGNIGEQLLSNIALVIINHSEPASLYGKEKDQYLDLNHAKKLFNVDLRIGDPYTGSATGNLGKQLSERMNAQINELEKTVSKYRNELDVKLIEDYEKLHDNFVFQALVYAEPWLNQMTFFQSEMAKTNSTFPDGGLPINICAYEEVRLDDYNNMIETFFSFKECT